MSGPNIEQTTTQIEQSISANSSSSAALYDAVDDILSASNAGGTPNAYRDIVANLSADDAGNTAKDYLPQIILSTFGEGTTLAATIGADGYTEAEIQAVIDDPRSDPVQVLAATAFLQRFNGVAGAVLQAHQRVGQTWDTTDGKATLDDVEMWATGTYNGDTSWATAMGYRPDIENLLVVTSSVAEAGRSPALAALANGQVATTAQIQADLRDYRAGHLELTPEQVKALEFLNTHSDFIGQYDKHTTTVANSHWVNNTWVSGISLGSINTVASRLGTSKDIALAIDLSIDAAGASLSVVDHVPDAQVVQTNPLAGGGNVKLDAEGRPVEINYPNGEYTRYTRDANGNLTRIQSSDGTFAFSGASGTWVREGNPPETVNAPVVNPDGSYSLTFTRDGQTYSETHRIDGSTIFTDSRGQVTRIVHADAANTEVIVRRDATTGAMTGVERIVNGVPEYITLSQQPVVDAATGNLTYTKDGRSITVLANGQELAPNVVVPAAPAQVVPTATEATAKHNAAMAFNALDAYQQQQLKQDMVLFNGDRTMKRRPNEGTPERAAWDSHVNSLTAEARNFINTVQDNWKLVDSVAGEVTEGTVNLDQLLSQGLVAPETNTVARNTEQTDFRSHNQTYVLDHQNIGTMAGEVLKARGITPENAQPNWATAVRNETTRIMILNGYRPDGGAANTTDTSGNRLKGWNNITWPQTFRIYDPADSGSAAILAQIDTALATPGRYNPETHRINPV